MLSQVRKTLLNELSIELNRVSLLSVLRHIDLRENKFFLNLRMFLQITLGMI